MSDTVPVRIVSESGKGRNLHTIEVAGVNLAGHSRAFQLSASVDSLVTLTLDMFVMNGLDITIPAAVTVNMQALIREDQELEEVVISDSIKRYRVVQKGDK